MALNLKQIGSEYGMPMEDYIAEIPQELPGDAVGFWQFYNVAPFEYDLSPEENIVFVRLCIKSLYDAGARPVTFSSDPMRFWELMPEFGETYAEIADRVVDWWQKSQKANDSLNQWAHLVWFATPEMCRAIRTL